VSSNWSRKANYFVHPWCIKKLLTFYLICQKSMISRDTFCLGTTLNVAFNSHAQSLITIMMSNNFVEVKGAVFKPNLFQMSCSDVRGCWTNLIKQFYFRFLFRDSRLWIPAEHWYRRSKDVHHAARCQNCGLFFKHTRSINDQYMQPNNTSIKRLLHCTNFRPKRSSPRLQAR